MKSKNLLILLLLVSMSWTSIQAAALENDPPLALWLKKYIPAQYPGVEVADNVDWFQAIIPEFNLTISWAYLPQEKLTLKEVHGHYEGKSLFISEPIGTNWATTSNIKHTKGAGYYLPSYTAADMGNFEVAKLSVLQFSGGDAGKFVDEMNKAWLLHLEKKQLASWLKTYIPSKYPGVKIIDHVDWFQAVIPKLNVTVNWAFLPQEKLSLKEVHGLFEGKPIFISEPKEGNWETTPNIEYTKGVGYYVPGYSQSNEGGFEVAKLTVIQFDGDGRKFIKKMIEARIANQ